jgi:parallel beta-helix repeat protein
MQSAYPKDGDLIVGTLSPTGTRLTTMTGAQLLTQLTRDSYGNYVAATTQTQPGQLNGACNPGSPRCGYPEDFFYDDVPYVHAAAGGATLRPGQYFFDYPQGKIYFRPANSADDPSAHKVEYSRARVAIAGNATAITVKNLIVEKYAIPDQFGAIGDQYPGSGWIVQNNEIRFNHGRGVYVASYSQLLNNYSHDNGQMGMGGSGTNILVQGNEIAHNIDYTGTDCGWECGGFKFAFTDGLVVRGNNVHDNAGPGMWTDLSNIRTLYENNTVTNNTGAGLFHEISYSATIRNNTIKNNGAFAPDDWLWNGQIQISTSQDVEAYGNIIEVNSATNGNGIMLIQQNRSNDACIYGPCKVANNYIHDNHITVTGTRWHATSGAAQDYTGFGDAYAASSNNRFAGNHYHVSDVNSSAYWQWMYDFRTFAGFKSFGLEANGTVDSNLTGDFAAPTVPSGLTAAALSPSQISLSWQPSTDNVRVAGYRIYRNGNQVGTAAAASYVDGSLSPATSYIYSIAAFDDAGNVSAASAPVNASTPSSDVTPPTVPSGVTATAISNTQIDLVWAASTDNIGVTGYSVYRNHVLAGTTPGTVWSDTGLTPGTLYSYNVAAFDAAGNASAQSATVSTTTRNVDLTPPSSPAGLTARAASSSQIDLSWTPSTDNVGVSGYRVYRNGSLVANVTAASWSDTGLAPATVYAYCVTAYDATGNVSLQSGLVSVQTNPDTTPPTTPAALRATVVSATQVNLSWSASTDNVGVAGYRIYRGGSLLGSTTATSYVDAGLVPSTAYSYSVVAYDVAGNTSPASVASSAVTAAVPLQVGSRAVTTDFTTVRLKPLVLTSQTMTGRAALIGILGVQPPKATGVIVNGPMLLAGVTWWFVDFDSGVDGWVSQDTLAAAR